MYLFNLLGTLALLDKSLMVGGPICPFLVTWDTSKIKSTFGTAKADFLCLMSISTQTPPRSCTSNAGDVRNRKEEKFDPKIHKDKVKTTRNKKKQLKEGQHYSIHAPLHTSTHTHTHTHTSCATSSDWIHRLRRPLLSYPYMYVFN